MSRATLRLGLKVLGFVDAIDETILIAFRRPALAASIRPGRGGGGMPDARQTPCSA